MKKICVLSLLGLLFINTTSFAVTPLPPSTIAPLPPVDQKYALSAADKAKFVKVQLEYMQVKKSCNTAIQNVRIADKRKRDKVLGVVGVKTSTEKARLASIEKLNTLAGKVDQDMDSIEHLYQKVLARVDRPMKAQVTATQELNTFLSAFGKLKTNCKELETLPK
ncbi:MAG: hypothetical protein Q8L85_05460 [Alphaproteobacteria bacterium]|nr:hypothetical protein [Alphaproteobacteria bacterium]